MSEPKVPENLKARVRYDREFDDNGHCIRYTTVARLIDTAGTVVASARAHLNPKDNPCRKTGRHKAIGRAVQNYYQNVDNA